MSEKGWRVDFQPFLVLSVVTLRVAGPLGGRHHKYCTQSRYASNVMNGEKLRGHVLASLESKVRKVPGTGHKVEQES